MKKVLSFFVAICLSVMLMPVKSSAQDITYSLNPNQCTIGLVNSYVDGVSVNCESADITVNLDGTLHLKAKFDVNNSMGESGFARYIPDNGKTKVEIVRVAFWWTTVAGTLTQVFDTQGILDSYGIMTVVCNVNLNNLKGDDTSNY